MVTVNGQKFDNNQVDKILLAEGIAELFPSINWGERLRIIQHLGGFYSCVLTDRISKDALVTPLANIPRLVKDITAIVSVPKEEPVPNLTVGVIKLMPDLNTADQLKIIQYLVNTWKATKSDKCKIRDLLEFID